MLRDREQEKERSEQRAIREAKRVCALIAKMVRDFWQNVDKVVDLRAQVEDFYLLVFLYSSINLFSFHLSFHLSIMHWEDMKLLKTVFFSCAVLYVPEYL